MTLAMQDALACMRAHGHLELRASGVWTVASQPPAPEWFVCRLTVRALVARGLAALDGRRLTLTAAGEAAAAAQAVPS